MKKIPILYLVGAILPLFLYSDAQPQYQEGPSKAVSPQYVGLPWLTGTLLTFSENVAPYKGWNIEPYLSFGAQYGRYDKHWNNHSLSHPFYSVLSTTYIQYGIAKNIDIQIVPQFAWNHTKGASQWTLGDLGVTFDFQLLYMKKERWWPSVKLFLSASAPLGKYQKLQPQKKGTDRGGTGSINPSAAIALGRIFQFSDVRFLRGRAFFSYTVPNAVHVKGLNVYGGGKETRGVVYPGSSSIGVVGFEYTFNPYWVISLDIEYDHINKQHFKGNTHDSMKAPSSEAWSLAPAIEYDWNATIGIISGIWFSAAGRNSPAFANWLTAVNVNF